MTLPPVLTAAAEDRLPEWGRARESRLAHMKRVARLLEKWARSLGSPGEERARWHAAGFLHDAVRDGDPEELRSWVPPEFAGLPDDLIHGPAAAARLREEGVSDEDFLRAVSFHTVGHPDLGLLGRSLYAADFLEPGRKFRAGWRKELRERMPEDLGPVLVEVAKTRVGRLLERAQPIPRETWEFWNTIVSERADG